MESSLSIDIHSSLLQPKITLLGVGGGGCKVVRNIAECSLDHVSLAACDVKDTVPLQSKIQCLDLSEAMNGHGTGGNIEVGTEIASKYREQIQDTIKDTNMLLIISTLGGGFGTGASPVIAKLAKELKILTVCIVTLPFNFESSAVSKADQGVLQLREHADIIIELPNDLLFNSDENDSAGSFFQQTDNFIKCSAQGITDIINTTGIINVDFADIDTVMREMGSAVIAQGRGRGESSFQQAIDNAIGSPLLQSMEIKDAKGLLLNIVGRIGILDLDDGIKNLESRLHEDVNTILGVAHPEDENTDDIHVTLILTGVPARQIVISQ